MFDENRTEHDDASLLCAHALRRGRLVSVYVSVLPQSRWAFSPRTPVLTNGGDRSAILVTGKNKKITQPVESWNERFIFRPVESRREAFTDRRFPSLYLISFWNLIETERLNRIVRRVMCSSRDRPVAKQYNIILKNRIAAADQKLPVCRCVRRKHLPPISLNRVRRRFLIVRKRSCRKTSWSIDYGRTSRQHWFPVRFRWTRCSRRNPMKTKIVFPVRFAAEIFITRYFQTIVQSLLRM